MRSDYLETKELTSIYFGGGTPSLLDRQDLEKIFSRLSSYFSWKTSTEITLEANPDDLSPKKLKELKDSAINRLSIGIQSFNQKDLTFMNRAHDALEAEKCIHDAHKAGFYNISADLIYGSPTTTDSIWESNIEKMIDLHIPHISAYCLTVEEGTALHHFVKTGKTAGTDDEKSSRQFDMLMTRMEEAGFDHYEISNFAKPGSYAVHNTNYWKGIPYLGIGPSAHSYDGHSLRSWNVAHNPKYIKSIQKGTLPIEHEHLGIKERYNEKILISLRTKWGLSEKEIQTDFPELYPSFSEKIQGFITKGDLMKLEGAYVLTKQGKHIADRISMELFAD